MKQPAMKQPATAPAARPFRGTMMYPPSQSSGVRIAARSADTIVTDPATSLGIPWGFTTRLVPGDPRATRAAAQ